MTAAPSAQPREKAALLPPGNWLDEFLRPPWWRPLRREGRDLGWGGGGCCGVQRGLPGSGVGNPEGQGHAGDPAL